MFDQSTDKESTTPNDEITSFTDNIADLVGESAIPGIPAPIRRSFLKALGQLCSAAIEVPDAYLTGIADERRAETSARIKLINVSAEQIARQMQTDPKYARIAAQKFGQRVIREQVNLDLISQDAAKRIVDDVETFENPEAEISDNTISDDWLNVFETEARQMSTEGMQKFFGKVLAGEVRRPGSYTTRAVKILGSLDQSVATLFLRLCSICISQFQDMRVPSLGGDPNNNALKEYGLDFNALVLLNEYGLVVSDYNSWREYGTSFVVQDKGQQTAILPFDYQGKHWAFAPLSDEMVGKNIKIHGVALSRSGRELSRIVEIDPNDKYSSDLASFLKRNGYRMTEVYSGEPHIVNPNAVTGLSSE